MRHGAGSVECRKIPNPHSHARDERDSLFVLQRPTGTRHINQVEDLANLGVPVVRVVDVRAHLRLGCPLHDPPKRLGHGRGGMEDGRTHKARLVGHNFGRSR